MYPFWADRIPQLCRARDPAHVAWVILTRIRERGVVGMHILWWVRLYCVVLCTISV